MIVGIRLSLAPQSHLSIRDPIEEVLAKNRWKISAEAMA